MSDGTAPTEEWRPVDGYAGYYEVSDLGRVRSLDRWVTHSRNPGMQRFWRGKILKNSPTHDGYWRVSLSAEGEIRIWRTHILVATAFHGPQPTPKHEVCHNDGDPKNARADNLRWGTKADNAFDAVSHGTHYNGSKTHCTNGHEFTPENTIVRENGRWRDCATCRDEYNARRRKTRVEAA